MHFLSVVCLSPVNERIVYNLILITDQSQSLFVTALPLTVWLPKPEVSEPDEREPAGPGHLGESHHGVPEPFVRITSKPIS